MSGWGSGLRWGFLLALAMAVGALVTGAEANTKPPSHPNPAAEPMRVAIVRSNDATCGLTCPEWVVAQGAITSETVAAFRRVLTSLGNRKLPILIQSAGGDVTAAMDIGRAIRRKHLDVIVAGTYVSTCGREASDCPAGTEPAGSVRGANVGCASACAILLAGGEHRYVPELAAVGIHKPQFIAYDKPGRGRLDSATQDRLLERLKVVMRSYFESMGVSGRIVDLAFETGHDKIHWLTRGELLELHLATNLTGGDALLASLQPASGSSTVQSVLGDSPLFKPHMLETALPQPQPQPPPASAFQTVWGHAPDPGFSCPGSGILERSSCWRAACRTSRSSHRAWRSLNGLECDDLGGEALARMPCIRFTISSLSEVNIR